MPGELSGLVLGCGSIGRRHLGNLLELGVEDVSAVDPDRDARRTVEREFGVETAPSVSDVPLEGVDFGVVCAPTSYHVDAAMELAEGECHPFIEKPLSNSRDGVDRLVRTIEVRGLVSMVACNMRFHPCIERVKQLVDAGQIGTVLGARIEAGTYLPDWHPDEDYRKMYSASEQLGGGVVLDIIHEIDYARWIFGEVELVTGLLSHESSLEIETEDVAGIVARFVDGPLCEFHLDYVQRPYSRSCHVIGEKGTIRWNWDDQTVRWYQAIDDEWRRDAAPDDWEVNDMYLDEIDHFLDCVRRERSTICDVDDGFGSLEVAIAAKESNETGTHISLPGG